MKPESIIAIDPIYLALLTPFFAAGLILALIPMAVRHGIVDHPGGRKMHEHSTPLVGGAAIILAFLGVVALTGRIPGGSLSLLLAITVTAIIGVLDDAHEIGHRSKFFAQVVASLLVVSGTGLMIGTFGNLFGWGELVLGKWGSLVTVIAYIGLMNAVNMIDGLDGLAGSTVMPPLLLFAGIALAHGHGQAGFELLVLAGAVAGFLFFNLRTPWRKRALVFMGDTGGLLLGLLLTWYAVALAGRPGAPLLPITAVWILAVPLLDMGSVMLVRMMQHKSPFHADRQHMHHVMLHAGYSVRQAVGIMAGASLGCGLAALLAQAAGVPDAAMFALFVLAWIAYTRSLLRPHNCMVWMKRLVQPHRPTAG